MCFGDQTTTQKSSIPKWLEQGGKKTVKSAQKFYESDYNKYKKNRVAGFTPAQTNAFTAIQNWASTPSAVPGEAIDLTRAAATAPATQLAGKNPGAYKLDDYGRIVDEGGKLGAIADYMNPYTQQALDPAIRDIERAYAAEQMRLGDRAAGANAYGDARHGVMEGATDRNRVEAIGDTSYRAFADAYTNAMANRQADLNRFSQRDLNEGQFYENWANRGFQRDMANAGFQEQALDRQLGGAAQMVGLDTIGQDNYFKQMMAGLGVGNQQQQQKQNKLDTKYEAWQLQMQDEYDRLAALVGAVGGVPYSRTTSSSQPDNSWAQLIGAGVGAFL